MGSCTSKDDQKSWYYSARIQRMIEKRPKFSSQLEFEITYSKVHWSELDSISQTKYSGEVNRKYFEELKLREEQSLAKFAGNIFRDWYGLFKEMDDLVVGNKMAEGAQAEIYEAGEKYVVKVFKSGSLLQDLEKQWPSGLLKAFYRYDRDGSLFSLRGATLLKDERFVDRFAFLMDKCWGDLRKYIDLCMEESSNQGPPLETEHVMMIMYHIAHDMAYLHKQKPCILHKDLKAANVLVLEDPVDSDDYDALSLHKPVTVADFECSIGVVGTGFWRASEILLQLKNRVPSSKMEFTKEGDVYSFGMTCYEVVTGRIPFEDHSLRDYDLVLNGKRPKLPPDLNPWLEGIICRCWHPDPSKRPTFFEIETNLESIWEGLGLRLWDLTRSYSRRSVQVSSPSTSESSITLHDPPEFN